MRILYGLVLAAGLTVATASDAKAQFSLTLGNPYTGQGLSIGNNPYGYGNGYSGYGGYGNSYGGYGNSYGGYGNSYGGYGTGYSGYSSGYSGYSSGYSSLGYAPAVTNYYSSGYSGIAPVIPYAAPAYGYSPYAVRSYGYAPYARSVSPYGGGYGYRRGFGFGRRW